MHCHNFIFRNFKLANGYKNDRSVLCSPAPCIQPVKGNFKTQQQQQQQLPQKKEVETSNEKKVDAKKLGLTEH